MSPEMPIDDAPLDQILITMGGFLFSGSTIGDIDTDLLDRAYILMEQELLNRGHIPRRGAIH